MPIRAQYWLHAHAIPKFRDLISCIYFSTADCCDPPNDTVLYLVLIRFFFSQCHHMSLWSFVVLSPGHGRSVTDFWGWDAHEAQLRCPDDVSGDRGRCSARRALKPKFYQPTEPMVTAGILPFRENSHGRVGNRTRDLKISSQRLWPLDYEAGHVLIRNVKPCITEQTRSRTK